LAKSFSSHTQRHLRTRALIGRACLGLCLHYFASDSLYSTFVLFFRISFATLSCYINWTLSVLNKALRNIPEVLLTMVNENYLKKVRDKIVQQHEPYIKRCVFILDGSLYQLELDTSAQYQYYDSSLYLDYNKWKEKQYKKSLYIFCFDRTIA
jgi:hypothetical protein